MNSVERVKSICKERKIPISKLEKELGFANGYIGQLRKGTFPADRLKAISEYLEVSYESLLTPGVTYDFETTSEPNMVRETTSYYLNDETKEIAQAIFENKELKMLFDVSRDASPEHLMAYYNLIKAMRDTEKGND